MRGKLLDEIVINKIVKRRLEEEVKSELNHSISAYYINDL